MPLCRRSAVPGACHFFTEFAPERGLGLLTANMNALRQSLAAVRAKGPFRVDAVVAPPDHPHCIWAMPAGDAGFSTRRRLIKAGFSRAVHAG